MKSRALSKPIEWIDEQLLREHSKLTKKWEDKGKSKYSLATILGLSGLAASMGTKELIYTLGTFTFARGWDLGLNTKGLTEGEHPTGIREYGDRLVVDSPIFFYTNKAMNSIRAPTFIFGSSFMIRGAINAYNYFANNDQLGLDGAINDFQVGISSLGFASSIYIRNSDPKLLQKESTWSKLCNWYSEKIDSLSPQPAPVEAYLKRE